MKKIYPKLISFSLFIASFCANADLPLTIEDIITDKGTWKLDLSISYANNNQKDLLVDEPIILQTSGNSFVSIPTKLGEFRQNTDVLVTSLGFKYGITRDAEIFTRASYLVQNTRFADLSKTDSQTENRVLDSWLGLNYQFLQDSKTPALLGFIEGALYEKHEHSSSSGKSWLFGLTSYRAIDPVVLSITSAFQWNTNRKDGGLNFQPGNYFLLTPSIAFAVNDRVTLTTGISWVNRQKNRYNGISQGYRQTSTDLQLGFGYGVAKGNTLNFSFKTNTSGHNGADLRLNWLYAF